MAVALLHLMPLLKLSTLAEVWMKSDGGKACRTVPLHNIHARKPELCKVLLAFCNLTSEDTTSKVGTKKGGLKAPTELLMDFDISDDTLKAKEYLVKVLSKSRHAQLLMNIGKISIIVRSLVMTILPPTSTGMVADIMRSRYARSLSATLSVTYTVSHSPLILLSMGST